MQSTYKPILNKEDVRGWSLTKSIPVPSADTALVLSRSGDDLHVIHHNDKPISFSKFRFGGYNFLYTVDVGEHVLDIECSLPSKTPGFDFSASVQITCSVFDPKLVVKSNLEDVSIVLKVRLINELKLVSRDYEFQENLIAEKDINRSAYRRVVGDGCFDDLGLKISQLVASLKIDSAANELIREKTWINLQKDATLEKEKAEAEVSKIREKMQLEIDLLKNERELANRKHYQELIEGGEASLLAALLAQNPGNVAALLERFDQQNRLASGNNMELLKIMIEEDAIEGSQLGDAGMRVLRRLMGTASPQAALQGDEEIENLEKENPDQKPQEEDREDLYDDVPE